MSLFLSKQPRALFYLFFSEASMCFAFFGVRGLLIFFLDDMKDSFSAASTPYTWYAIYAGGFYLMCMIGGILGHVVFSPRAAVFWGMLWQTLGHAGLYLAEGAWTWLCSFFFLLLGAGSLKTHMTSLVGRLYTPKDPRRDAGFALFYMSVNVGALIAPLVLGVVSDAWGYKTAFGWAGLGMLISSAFFVLAQKTMLFHHDVGTAYQREKLHSKEVIIPLALSAGSIGMLYLFFHFFPARSLNTLLQWGLLPLLSLSILFCWSYMVRSSTQPYQRKSLYSIGVLLLALAFQSIALEQEGGTLNRYAEEHVVRDIFGYCFPAAFFQGLNPLFVVLLSWVVNRFWEGKSKQCPYQMLWKRFALGMLLLGISCWVMSCAEWWRNAKQVERISPWWLVMVYVQQTLAELSMLPATFAFVSQVAPAHLSVWLIGLLWGSISVGTYLSGTLGSLTSSTSYGFGNTFAAIGSSFFAVGLLCSAWVWRSNLLAKRKKS